MFNNKFLVLLMFILILSISAVNAQDNITEDVGVHEESALNQPDQETLQSTGESSSFKDLNDEISKIGPGGNVTLKKNYRYSSNDSDYKDGILIAEDNIIIDGDGYTIDGAGQARIFNIIASNVTLINIKFINGYTSGNGGAISANNNLNILDSLFNNNTADKSGGAVFVESSFSNSKINSTFINNGANNGGAIYFKGTTDNVTINGRFEGNEAIRAGGALYFAQKSNYNTITAEFYNNNAKGASGGAIFFYRLAENNQFESVFRSNHALYGAGIFFYNKANNNRFNCDFRFNVAESCGGAMFFYNTTDGNNFSGYFINNSALGKVDEINGNGGAITFKNTSSNSIFTCDFVNNTAVRTGGGVNYRETPYNITFNSNFINNKAEVGGGVNFFETFENVVFNGKFTDNYADNGGGIAIKKGVIENTSFLNNHAETGGAVYFRNDGTIIGCNFTGNRADNGGAIYVNGSCKLIDCILTNNTAAHNGGAVYWNTNAVGITNCTFEKNTAKEAGGANYFNSAVTNVILTGNFNNNTASINGGANYFWGTVDNGALTGNFTNNTAKEAGGANYFYNTVTNVTLTGIFTNNRAETGDGDANHFKSEIINVNLIGNYINNTGLYVIYIGNSVSGNVIRDSIFINNAPIKVFNGNITVIDNWFGNNVTNYNVKPEVGIDLDNWLFLNGTADPNPVSVANTSIIFTLSRYDGNNVSSYDNSRLTPIKLDITSTLGGVNPNTVNLNESITYTQVSIGVGSVTASFENVLCSIEIEILKVGPDMSIESYPSYAGDNATITIILPSDAGGNVTVTDADGNNYARPVKDGVVDIEVPGLPAGDNNITVTYSGDDQYARRTVDSTVHVDLMPTFLSAEVLEKYQGDDDRVAVVMYDARENPVAGMPVRIHIVGKVYNCTTNESGVATLPINLKPGIYPVTVEFAGKGDYANATPVSSEVHVLTKVRIDKNKDLVKDYGDADKFTVRLVDEYGKPVAGEVVNMTVAGKTYHCKSNADGYASLAINLKPGTYDIVCEYAGYKTTNKITVKQVLSAYNRQYKKASSYQFAATLKHTNGNPISGKTVTFTFKGKTYTKNTNGKGEATITIKEALSLGTYNIAIKYLDSTIKKTIKIV